MTSSDLNGGGSNVILKFTPDGMQSTFVSEGIIDGAHFTGGLAFDSSGNLFSGIYGPFGGPDEILKFTPDGSKGSFFGPVALAGLAFDSSRNLFGADFQNGYILKISPSGNVTDTFGSGLGHLGGLAFDSSGNLFVVNGNRILKFTSAGTQSTFTSGLNGPSSLAFEPVTEKLRNVSARGFVQSGENIFIVGGNAVASSAVVVRAIGPSLSHFAIANPLQAHSAKAVSRDACHRSPKVGPIMHQISSLGVKSIAPR